MYIIYCIYAVWDPLTWWLGTPFSGNYQVTVFLFWHQKIPLLSERCCLGGQWFLPWTLDVYINSSCHIWWIFMLPSQSSADFIFSDGKLFVYKLIQVFMALYSVPNHFPSQNIHWYINKSQSNNDQENCFKLTFHSSKYCCSYIQWYHCQLTLSNDNSVCCCDPITIENWKPQDDVLS